MTAGLKILTGILLVLIAFSFFSCGSKKLILEKHGVSYDGKDGQVVSYQDLRRLYDAQSYQTLYDLLEPVPEMNIEDYFIHFLLIQSGVQLKRQDHLEKAYGGSARRYFYLGLLAYDEGRYADAAAYFKLLKSKDPAVDYFIGSALLFSGERMEALGYLMLSRRWKTPWPYLALASYYEMEKDQTLSLENLAQAENETYDFEKNLATDIQVKKGELLFLKQNYEEALFYAMQVYERDKEKSLSLIDPGEIYLAWGKSAEAEAFWKKASEDVQVSDEIKQFLLKKLQILKSIEQ